MNPDAAIVTTGDITIDSNHENADQIAMAFTEPDAPVSDEGEAPSAPNSPITAPLEATVADGEAEAPEVEEALPSKSRRRNPQAAVQAAIARQREAERRAVAAESQLAILSERRTTQKDAPVAAPVTPEWARIKALPNSPRAESFENYDDYTAALSTFVTDTRQREHDTRRHQYLQEQTQKETHAAKATEWQERLTKARSDNPDLDSTLDPDVSMSLPMQYLAMESPVGVEILQYLSANPDESQRMSTLHPAEVYRSMGRLEERLSAASTPSGPARAISHAKPPIQPLGSSPHTPDTNAVTEDLSFEEHFKRMNAADRKAGRF
jgi:hypothetical protein